MRKFHIFKRKLKILNFSETASKLRKVLLEQYVVLLLFGLFLDVVCVSLNLAKTNILNNAFSVEIIALDRSGFVSS